MKDSDFAQGHFIDRGNNGVMKSTQRVRGGGPRNLDGRFKIFFVESGLS